MEKPGAIARAGLVPVVSRRGLFACEKASRICPLRLGRSSRIMWGVRVVPGAIACSCPVWGRGKGYSMSYVTMGRAREVRGLSMAERAILYRLADMSNDDGMCFPSVGSLAHEFECSLRHVRGVIAGLEARGIVRRVVRINPKTGLQRSNEIWVCPVADRVPDEGGTMVPGRNDSSPSEAEPGFRPGRNNGSSLGRNNGSAIIFTETSIETGEAGSAPVSVDPSSLTRFQRSEVLAGRSVLVAGSMIRPDAPEGLALALALRSAFAEN